MAKILTVCKECDYVGERLAFGPCTCPAATVGVHRDGCDFKITQYDRRCGEDDGHETSVELAQ